MVPAGQLRRELAADPALRGPGRHGRGPQAGGPHVPHGGPLGPAGPGEVAQAVEPAGAGGLSAGGGAAAEPAGVSARASVAPRLVPAAGGRAAAFHPEPGRALDRRRVPGGGAPSGGHLRPLPAAGPFAGRSVSGPPGLRGAVPEASGPDRGRAKPGAHRLRGFGEPADGAPQRPAGGAGGGGGPAPGPALGPHGPGGRGGDAGHRGRGGAGGRARVRGPVAPASRDVPGAAPRGGAP